MDLTEYVLNNPGKADMWTDDKRFIKFISLGYLVEIFKNFYQEWFLNFLRKAISSRRFISQMYTPINSLRTYYKRYCGSKTTALGMFVTIQDPYAKYSLGFGGFVDFH